MARNTGALFDPWKIADTLENVLFSNKREISLSMEFIHVMEFIWRTSGNSPDFANHLP